MYVCILYVCMYVCMYWCQQTTYLPMRPRRHRGPMHAGGPCSVGGAAAAASAGSCGRPSLRAGGNPAELPAAKQLYWTPKKSAK